MVSIEFQDSIGIAGSDSRMHSADSAFTCESIPVNSTFAGGFYLSIYTVVG